MKRDIQKLTKLRITLCLYMCMFSTKSRQFLFYSYFEIQLPPPILSQYLNWNWSITWCPFIFNYNHINTRIYPHLHSYANIQKNFYFFLHNTINIPNRKIHALFCLMLLIKLCSDIWTFGNCFINSNKKVVWLHPCTVMTQPRESNTNPPTVEN